jgi:hypothetical protein
MRVIDEGLTERAGGLTDCGKIRSMYELQKQIQRELDTRIPRGPRGSLQNQFRFVFCFFRSQRVSFEESIAKAVASIREREPDFAPKVS